MNDISSVESNITVLTPSTDLLISVADFKIKNRVSGTAEDDLIELYIRLSQKIIEEYTGRSIFETIYVQSQRIFPGERENFEIVLKRAGSVNGVPVIKCMVDGELTTISTSEYSIAGYLKLPPVIYLKPNKTWPICDGVAGGIQITFTCGESEPENIDPMLVQAVTWMASHCYQHRVPVNVGGGVVNEVPFSLKMLLNLLKVYWV